MRFTTLSECKKIYLFVACFVGGFLPLPSYANTNTILTLQYAITQTLAQNPQLYQYTFVKEAFEGQKQTHSLRPALELEVDIENFAGSGSLQGFDSAETTLALSSVIEMGSKRTARMSVINARLNRTQWQQQATTLDVLGELTTLYIEGLASQANISLAKESLAVSQLLLRTVKLRAARGATSEAEVLRATAAVTQAQIRLAALVNRFERQKVNLARFWGQTKPTFTRLEGSLFEFGEGDSFEQLYARVKHSPAIQIFASEARVKDAEVTLARASARSDLTWRAGVRRFEDTGDSALMAGISIPLFSKKRSSGDVKTALAQRNAVDYSKQESLLRLHAKLYEAWSLRKQNIDAVNKTRQSTIPALEKALKLTREAYENGRYRYIDWVVAQEELLSTKQGLIDAATIALVSQALIERLTSEALVR